MITLETARLRLRPLAEQDREALVAMNADPEVMEHFPSILSPEETDAFCERVRQSWAQHGIGFAAVESRENARFLGFAGLAVVRFETPVQGLTEIGWRFARAQWCHGYATEAARAWMAYGFDALKLDRIVSFTTAPNHRSLAVMRRLGMARRPDLDFEHPALPLDHLLRPHLVFERRADAGEA
ncbi:MAG: GNAT family N-acetyltransferase [Pseudomonadota bacterium]